MIVSVVNKIIDKLVENGKVSIYGLGTFYVKPARKGAVYTKYGVLKTHYKWRVVFKTSRTLKNKINERLK